MNKNSKNANIQSKLAAMRLAEIKATDKEDLIACANDMQKTASLDKDEAIIVASAIRSKYLPNVVRQAGLDVSNLDLEDGKETVDFTNDLSDDDDDDEVLNMGTDDDTEDMDDTEDIDEEEEFDDVATIEIEVPADMVDAAQKAVQEALDNLLSGKDDSDDEEDEDITHFDDMDSDEDSDDDENLENIKTSNKVNEMNRTTLAERKALREALIRKAEREEMLMKLASEEETVQTSAGFKYNESMVSMSGNVDYPTMSLENDGGNSLKKDNDSLYTDQSIPTNMKDSLQFPEQTKPMKLDGTPELEVFVNWNEMNIPSEGIDKNYPKVPSQLPGMPHKTTVAAKSEVECTACGERMAMTDEEMNDAATRCANKDCPTNASDEGHADDNERKAESTTELVNDAGDLSSGISSAVADLGNAKNKANDAAQTFNSSLASLETARLKTAYSCSTKLALAGIITTDEVDSYAEQMLHDGLKADSMIRQTKLLLKSAQSSSERIAAAAAERTTRTASNIGISTTPAFGGGHTANSAALDIQGALKGLWTMPTTED